MEHCYFTLTTFCFVSIAEQQSYKQTVILYINPYTHMEKV